MFRHDSRKNWRLSLSAAALAMTVLTFGVNAEPGGRGGGGGASAGGRGGGAPAMRSGGGGASRGGAPAPRASSPAPRASAPAPSAGSRAVSPSTGPSVRGAPPSRSSTPVAPRISTSSSRGKSPSVSQRPSVGVVRDSSPPTRTSRTITPNTRTITPSAGRVSGNQLSPDTSARGRGTVRITPSGDRINRKPTVDSSGANSFDTNQPANRSPSGQGALKPAALDDRGARDIRGSGRTRTNETSNSADLGIDASGGKGQFKNPAPIKDNSPFKKPASLDGKGSFKNPASVGGLQTIDKSPIKPAALNGSVKPGLNKPFYSGQFKGASPACGHSVCGGHSGCSFSGHFSHHVSSCWYPSYGSYCNYGWGSGFGFWYGSSGWSIGFSYNSGYGWPYWGYNSCYWPSYWHGGYCGGYWPYRSHCYYPVYYPYYPYYYSSYYVPVYSDPIYYSVEETYVPAPAPYDEKQAAPAAENGWELLDQGDAREARRFFAREIGLHPNDGLPQIGYAIASTLIDRKIEAISMMRRAMKNDPEAILEVPQTQGIAQAIEAALDAYEDMSDRRPDNIDAQFMIAATRYMLGDISRAYFAADRAIDWGDKDASAANLRALLRKAIEQPAPPQLQPQPQPQSPPPGSSPAPPAQPVHGPPVNDPPPVPSVVPEEKPWEVPF